MGLKIHTCVPGMLHLACMHGRMLETGVETTGQRVVLSGECTLQGYITELVDDDKTTWIKARFSFFLVLERKKSFDSVIDGYHVA
jgi:hypothetical protein